MRIERDAAVHAAEQQSTAFKVTTNDPAPDSIPRPKNMNKVKISDVREKLDLAGDENKPEWLDLRVRPDVVLLCLSVLTFIQQVIRDMTTAGFIDWTLNWRSQKSKKLGKIYDAVRDLYTLSNFVSTLYPG